MFVTDEARTPVVVGVGAVQQREGDPSRAREPVALMIDALGRAAADAGDPALLRRAEWILVPRGLWHYPDPGRLVARGIGAPNARSVLAEVGVLQTTILGEAARLIAAGEASVVVVTGGEAQHRARRAQMFGHDAPSTPQPEGTAPDVLLTPSEDVLHPLEIERGLLMPVTQFAMIDSALRHADGASIEEHRDQIAELWAGFSRVAAHNAAAWSREVRTPREIATPSEHNRMLAFPYAKLHASQWTVDQAAGLIVCSAAVARETGVPRDRWIFPLGVVDSNYMVPLCERASVHRSPGFACAGRRLSKNTGVPLDSIDHVELYSCFPAAVRVQLRELELPADRPLTLTGGMTFAGGPLNNFVLQALVRMAEVLRETPATTGLLTAVSGILNKQGTSLWASRTPERPFVHDDVGHEVARAVRRVCVHGDHEGAGTVVAYTVIYEGGEPRTGVALVDLPQSRRTIATTGDATLIDSMLRFEFCGRSVMVGTGARLLT